MAETPSSTIVYSCYHEVSRKGENFVPQHTLSLQLSGSFVLSHGKENYTAREGELHLIRKNQLVKFAKYPPEKGVFESMNIYLSQEHLINIAKEYGISANRYVMQGPFIPVHADLLLQNYLDSLKVMAESEGFHNSLLMDLKIKELLLILLQLQPALKDILFDFSAPDKIDLEAFMMQNYHYNVKIERFAFLTGRSLATFKRDFEKIFHMPPRRWLLEKRLEEAHFLIKEKEQTASAIYLDLGFEDLSHFSFAFKKHFGYNPTTIGKGLKG